ncbi:uncharacterized protein LOC132282123 [Cornus florida]|uniref:uncharacterized protein LOC132282123 n=1 Tax=Cornus florida TaxID=4283 RepID=UPI00289E2F88|nr:uncharacterized protein LOC132282123 [Cornus florida]
MANKLYHIRSISLPCRSHPTTLRIDEELNKLKTWEEASSTPTAETICNGLSRLQELYKCLDDLHNLPVTQQALSHHQHEKWTNELLDKSLVLLDICGVTRDVLSQMREHVIDVQSAMRRRKGDLSSIAKYTSFRKKMKEDAKKMIESLKQMDNKIEASSPSLLLESDHHMSSLIRVLREVNTMSISVFHTLLLFLCVPISKPMPITTRWSLVSKLLHKGTVGCKEQQENVNELGSVDMALHIRRQCGSNEEDKMQRLGALEGSIEVIENGSECMFRRLMKSRASLLNMVSL